MLRSYLALLRRLFPTVPFSPGAGQVPIPSGHSCSKGQSEPLGARLAAQGWPQGWDDAAAGFGCSAPTASSSHVRRGLRWVPACPCIPTGTWLLFHPGRDLLASNTRRRGLQSFRWGNARGDTPPPAKAGEEHTGFWAQSWKPQLGIKPLPRAFLLGSQLRRCGAQAPYLAPAAEAQEKAQLYLRGPGEVAVTFFNPPSQLHPNCVLSYVTGWPGIPASGCIWEVRIFPSAAEGHIEKVRGRGAKKK